MKTIRLLIQLKAAKDQPVQESPYNELQGLFYRVCEQAGFSELHEKKGFKYTSFSNIFPPEDMEDGDTRTWIISSMHDELLHRIKPIFQDLDQIRINENSFRINDAFVFNPELDRKNRLISGTPIVVRLNQQKVRKHDIDSKYDQTYWRQEYPLNAFIEAVEGNLVRKYESYYDGREAPPRPYFQEMTCRKEVACPVSKNDGDFLVIGTHWTFEVAARNRDEWRLLELACNSGLGELNTLGFGFMNPVVEDGDANA